jgi:quinol monooxygenase YgiN
MDDHIALFINMHPASAPKQSTLLSSLRQGARGFYRLPSTRCIAWSYFTPVASPEPTHDGLIVAGVEIYTSKAALQDQLNDTTFFQPFEKLVRDQQLCDKKETMVAWYLAAGFLTRSHERSVGGGSVIVRVHQMTCTGSGEKEAVVNGLGEFAGWSRGSDYGVLTFAVFTRKKAPREVLVYVRYRNEGTMRRVEERPEHQNFW